MMNVVLCPMASLSVERDAADGIAHKEAELKFRQISQKVPGQNGAVSLS
jgi:hypothetical protein